MIVRLAIRGFAGSEVVFEDRVDVDSDNMDELLLALATKHGAAMAPPTFRLHHMIEMEFLDEPDPLKRFFRIGTDPSGMPVPIGWRLQ